MLSCACVARSARFFARFVVILACISSALWTDTTETTIAQTPGSGEPEYGIATGRGAGDARGAAHARGFGLLQWCRCFEGSKPPFKTFYGPRQSDSWEARQLSQHVGRARQPSRDSASEFTEVCAYSNLSVVALTFIQPWINNVKTHTDIRTTQTKTSPKGRTGCARELAPCAMAWGVGRGSRALFWLLF